MNRPILGGLLLLISSALMGAQKAIVTIDISELMGEVNHDILGNSLWYSTHKTRGEQYNRAGGGLWNLKAGTFSEEHQRYAREAGVSVLRWPGGKWRLYMDWKNKQIGPARNPFGLPEYLAFCDSIGAKPLITLSADHAEQVDIPALVAYLNEPLAGDVDEAITPKGTAQYWAQKRAEDGRREPWNVTLFEYGNENFLPGISIDTYIVGFKDAYRVIKQISPQAQLGAVLEDTDNVDSGWTSAIFSELGELFDFAVIHPYIPIVNPDAIEVLGYDLAIQGMLYSDANLQYRLDRYKQKAAETGYKGRLRFAATEYNTHFTQDKPFKIRHSLLSALHNADFIRVMLQPDNDVLLAIHWHLVNAHWGIMHNDYLRNGAVSKRPNFYMLKLYNDYLLDQVASMSVDVASQEVEGFINVGPRLSEKVNVPISPPEMPEKWSRRLFTGGKQEQNDGIVTVEFTSDELVDYYHASRDVKVQPNTNYRVSAKVKSTNLLGGKVGLAVQDARGWRQLFYQASNMNVTGTTDWQWVSVEFRTLSDTDKIVVMARKHRGHQVASGFASFGEAKIEVLPGQLPVGKMVVGIATVSSDKSLVSMILLNKNTTDSITASVDIPLGYQIKQSTVLGGTSVLASNSEDGDEGEYWVKESVEARLVSTGQLTIELERHSLTAIMLEREIH